MSRKREQQRESKKELARQLGVSKDEVPDELRAHARASDPELKARLVVAGARRGLLTRARPLRVQVALFVVDAAGARLARVQSWTGRLDGSAGEVALSVLSKGQDATLRYTRPGHFTLVALVTEGAEEPALGRADALLTNVGALRIVRDGKSAAVGDASISRLDVPASVALEADGAQLVADKDALFVAAAAVSVAAAHRVHQTLQLPLVSAGEKLQATLSVELRV